jgi:CHAT domain-containing protein
LRNPQRRDVTALARSVDRLLMQPVRRLVGESSHLLVSPDGQLNLIPFAALIDEQNRYLIERYTLTYLTSGRDLLRLHAPIQGRGAPVVVALPEFGEPALLTSRSAARKSASPGAPRVDDSQIFFGPLPGVAGEVRALRTLLPDASFLTREQATEAALKALHGPRILHIATHGFFLGDTASSKGITAPANAGTRLAASAATTDNPLLRSGLALSGANQGRSGDDDGVLTALEAAGLDLWGTRLVVLSACDTGVGEVKQGDGVYGLRRAFVIAGAETQLMSLWAVSDRSTRDLMGGYYARLTKGSGRGQALRETQLQLLRDGRHAHPYHWASFIQSGAWTSLDGAR